MACHLSALLPRYVAAYRMLRSLTPLPGDCGKLCNSRCCKGDKERGMLLFPHEGELLSHAGYEITRRSMGGRQVEFAVCSGVCRRSLRPLSWLSFDKTRSARLAFLSFAVARSEILFKSGFSKRSGRCLCLTAPMP